MALYYCLSLSLYFTFTHQSYLENHSSSQHCNSTRGVGVNAKRTGIDDQSNDDKTRTVTQAATINRVWL